MLQKFALKFRKVAAEISELRNKIGNCEQNDFIPTDVVLYSLSEVEIIGSKPEFLLRKYFPRKSANLVGIFFRWFQRFQSKL